jgi:hypothetical protein
MNEFRSANALAHALNDSLGDRFVPRPYNRFSPDSTVWWLVPSSDWPSYEYGKFFFDDRPRHLGPQSGVYCGFHVEKGLSKRIAEFFRKDLIETDEWAWEAFVKNISDCFPVFSASQVLSVHVSYIPAEKASYLDSPESFLSQKEQFAASSAVFTIDSAQKLELLDIALNASCSEIADHFDGKVRNAFELKTLLADLVSFPQSDWSWVDMYIGRVADHGTIGGLWNDHLKPWSSWIGTSYTARHGRA